MITNRLIDRNVKFTRSLRFPQEASSSNKLLLVAVLAILGALTACGDAHLPLLTSIQVSPANSTIGIGQTQQFTALGAFSDGSSKDLTSLVTWSSSNTTAAAISASGLALGQGKGSSMISATFKTVDGPVTGATSLGVIVTLKSMTITPVNPSIANGTNLQLTATGIFSDGSTQNLTASASWSSSSGAIATVSSSRPTDRDRCGERDYYRDSGRSLGYDHRHGHGRGTDLDHDYSPEFFYRQGNQRTIYCERDFLGRHDPGSHRVCDLGFLRWVHRNGQQCSR